MGIISADILWDKETATLRVAVHKLHGEWPLFAFGAGHKPVVQALSAAGCYARHAAYAVGGAHELRFGYGDIHGAGARALTAVTAFVGGSLNAEDTQHTPEPSASTTGAEVIAEGALKEHGDN